MDTCNPRELPILFTAEMIRAILSGAKTSTRRPITPATSTVDGSGSPLAWAGLNFCPWWEPGDDVDHRCRVDGDASRGCGEYLHVPRPSWGTHHRVRSRIEVGDVLYVRETWAEVAADHGGGIVYAADYQPPGAGDYGLWRHRTKPATWFDGPWKPSIHMKKEHARLHLRVTAVRCERVNAISEEDAQREGVSDVATFRSLWDSLYPAAPFDSGPWVWVVDFERVTP